MRKNTQEQFEKKFEMIPECGCWLWTAGCTDKGYGQFRLSGVNKLAHRTAWEFYRGPIPAGLCVLHRCDTPACVNPYHLFLGTQYDNAQDRENKNRRIPPKGAACNLAKLYQAAILKIRIDERSQEIIAKEFG